MDSTFFDAVAALAQGSPYRVEATEQGFDVQVDVANARWYGLIDKRGLAQTLTHRVTVDPARKTFEVLDDLRTVEWQAGQHGRRPVLSASATRQLGRTVELGRRKEWGWDEKLRHGKVLDYTLSTEESRALIRTAARRVGYRERQPAAARLGIAMAVIGGGGALVAVVALVVGALLGKF